MDGVALTTTTISSAATCLSTENRRRFFSVPFTRLGSRGSGEASIRFRRNRRGIVVFGAKDEEEKVPKLDEYDQMELKFGRLLGEDPKLTLAKIMARKVNPDVSYLEVEKSFYKNKGEIVEIEELPFDVSDVKKPSRNASSAGGLNLNRPVPKNGFDFPDEDKPGRPLKLKVKKPSPPVDNGSKVSVPNVILRKKPTMFVEDDVEDKTSSSRVRIKSNLTLKMGSGLTEERFTDMTLLRKPQTVVVDEKKGSVSNVEAKNVSKDGDEYDGFTLLEKPEMLQNSVGEFSEVGESSVVEEQEVEDVLTLGRKPLGRGDVGSTYEETSISGQADTSLENSASKVSKETSLLGKPQRFDRSVQGKLNSIAKVTNRVDPQNNADNNQLLDPPPTSTLEARSPVQADPSATGKPASSANVTYPMDPGSNAHGNQLSSSPPTSPLEDADWSRAEYLFRTGVKEEVELISSSTRGFVVTFRSLIGFLPYRNLGAKWKFLAFESWLKQKGLDPSMYRKNLAIIGKYDVADQNPSADSSRTPETDSGTDGKLSSDMTLEDLLRIYDQEKLKFLSSFVGQKTKVNVVMVDWKMRKLVVSLRPKEKEESVEKKRNLMATLQVGDVLKCCIKKITYFGIFVEVEGVPALIHQTEVSWDATLDPVAYFKIGQIVEAKVHQLDFTLERIFLSLKEITPDPLTEALETIVGYHDPLDGRLQPAEIDGEWADVESLIKELQQIEGVQSVSRGRFFLSPGLAPTFQVYLASMFENQYKLLARSENKVQEVIVQASLDKEQMKAAILSSTNKVE